MKPAKILLSAFSLLLATAVTGQATESTSWGTLKSSPAWHAAKPGGGGPSSKGNVSITEAAEDEHAVSALISSQQGGKLLLNEKMGTPTKEDDLGLSFYVAPGALDQDTQIDMAMTGTSLDDLVISFAPAGLVFNIPALLTIKIGVERCGTLPDDIVMHHIHGDGTVEEARITQYQFSQDGGYYKIEVEVPGFSRYSGGGGY